MGRRLDERIVIKESMGQHLGGVPPAFVLVAGAFVLTPELLRLFRQRRREVTATIAILAAAFCIERGIVAVDASRYPLSPAERGRAVYISEGCINCHSQYVRPDTPDVLMWGPAQTLEELRREHTPLIGNRRQGPDLAEVGNRRSPLWLKATSITHRRRATLPLCLLTPISSGIIAVMTS